MNLLCCLGNYGNPCVMFSCFASAALPSRKLKVTARPPPLLFQCLLGQWGDRLSIDRRNMHSPKIPGSRLYSCVLVGDCRQRNTAQSVWASQLGSHSGAVT